MSMRELNSTALDRLHAMDAFLRSMVELEAHLASARIDVAAAR